ncbi:PilZ domain-containing protein [Sulfurivermis fontis]|uniref:PilZ domain-containing protein n=1 Tax=Sulfurivermis fontis TaxID=1972068 RepID=UPI000FD74CCF|nr:PilZ domain-containing protein [Sulfurivermis fontis]
MKEKRHFQRIPMDGHAALFCGGDRWDSRLLDISLKGALIVCPTDWQADSASNCQLELRLDGDVVICMDGTVVHCENGHLGFRCDHIELDSITHLKRLVELNLGDEALLERELTELSQGR